jgi:hypothetical protein
VEEMVGATEEVGKMEEAVSRAGLVWDEQAKMVGVEGLGMRSVVMAEEALETAPLVGEGCSHREGVEEAEVVGGAPVGRVGGRWVAVQEVGG